MNKFIDMNKVERVETPYGNGYYYGGRLYSDKDWDKFKMSFENGGTTSDPPLKPGMPGYKMDKTGIVYGRPDPIKKKKSSLKEEEALDETTPDSMNDEEGSDPYLEMISKKPGTTSESVPTVDVTSPQMRAQINAGTTDESSPQAKALVEQQIKAAESFLMNRKDVSGNIPSSSYNKPAATAVANPIVSNTNAPAVKKSQPSNTSRAEVDYYDENEQKPYGAGDLMPIVKKANTNNQNLSLRPGIEDVGFGYGVLAKKAADTSNKVANNTNITPPISKNTTVANNNKSVSPKVDGQGKFLKWNEGNKEYAIVDANGTILGYQNSTNATIDELKQMYPPYQGEKLDKRGYLDDLFAADGYTPNRMIKKSVYDYSPKSGLIKALKEKK